MIATNYHHFRQQLDPKGVKLVAVSKFQSVEAIHAAYEAGCRDFGENYVQELVDKQAQLPADIAWHLIGHLQTNKVKYVAPFVHLIQSVDSRKLLAEIQKQAAKCQRTIQVLLQVQIAVEDTKTGMSEEEVEGILGELGAFPEVQVVGLMGMASFTDDLAQVQSEFQQLKSLFDRLVAQGVPAYFNQISMGMSGDWQLAVEEGSTLVRIGSAIFGERKNQ